MKKRSIWHSICCRLDQLEQELDGLCSCLRRPKKECDFPREFCELQVEFQEKCQQKNGCCR